MSQLQDKQEMRAFQEFAEVCPLNLFVDQAIKQDPKGKKPDIVCPVGAGGRSIEFELVSANDKDMDRRVNDSFDLEKALHNEFKSAIEANFEYSLADWSGLTVEVILDESASKRNRLVDIPRAIEILLDIGPTLGRHPIRGEKTIQRICVQRNQYADWETEKPSLIVQHAGYIGAPIVSRIEQKLDKAREYYVVHPFHLLCYARTTLIAERWIPSLIELLASHPNKDVFDRIWVHDQAGKSIVFDSESFDMYAD